MKPRSFRADLLPKIRDLEIEAKQQVLSATLSGEWISRLRGHGIEFAGYRQYTTGDDASLIDWKASLRSRRLVIKELQEEKNLNIYLFVDVSDTMLVGTVDKIKAEYAAELASSLAFASLHSGENVSLALWSDHLTRFAPLGHGVGYHHQLMRQLLDPDQYGGVKDITKATAQLLAVMPTPGLILLVSDCIGFDEKWERALKILSTRHDLMVLIVRDPRDRRLPASGEYVLEDPTGGQKLVIDAADYAEPYQQYVAAEEQRIETLVRRAGADIVMLETSQPFKDPIRKAFAQRKSRWWRD
jgi:uncharacterized protein (DUF58 family)